jgi:hypothetical protein
MSEGSEIYVYIKAPRFGRFMERLFQEGNLPYELYMPRKLTNDKSGTLAMALVSVRCEREVIGLYSAAIHISFERLGALLMQMNSPSGMWSAFYRGELSRFLAIVEGVWVYLFLAYESGWEDPEITSTLAASEFDTVVKSWRMRRPVDTDLLSATRQSYLAITR